MEKQTILSIYNNERGVSAILIAILMFVFLGFAALALDLSHIFVAQNELHNAADAGALAGARFLYNDDGTAVNAGANQIAYDAALANTSENVPVEVNWTSGNTGDVLRGHWSFAAKSFSPRGNTDPPELWGVSSEDLDANPNFVNAVQVTTRREAAPIVSFFARIFGIQNFQRTATAVAYIGFAGTLQPLDVDQPIAICKDSILQKDGYTCTVGRMINSGQDIKSHQTGGWTDFNQDNPCSGGTNANEVKGLVCGNGNAEPIVLGKNMATSGGEIESAFKKLRECWNNHLSKNGPVPWNLTLPVITCPDNNVGTCEKVVGAVNLNIVWITDSGEDKKYENAPREMGNWSSSESCGHKRWASFVSEGGGFNLKNADGSPAPYAKKSIYFLPDCTPHEPAGVSGGEAFGILARIPVLVE